MHLLLASLLPLLLGPLLAGALRRCHAAARALDAFVLVSIGGLVLLHILPQSIVQAGGFAILAAILGAALPMVGSKIFSTKPGAVRTATLLVDLGVLALHAIMDGIALATHNHGHSCHAHDHGSVLGLAVVLHRIPVGLAIWWLVRPRLGLPIAIISMVAIAVSSVIGFFGAHYLYSIMNGVALSSFQAMVAGSLLHVVVGHSTTAGQPEHSSQSRWQLPSVIGCLLGVGTVVGLADAHPLEPVNEFHLHLGTTFLTLARESALPLLLAYSLAVLLHILLPNKLRTWLRVGANPAPAVILVSVFLSFRLLGAEVTLAHLLAAVGLALVAGLWVGRVLSPNHAPIQTDNDPPKAPWPPRIREGIHFGFKDVADSTLPWIVLGLLIAAVLEPLLDPARIAQLPAGLDIPVLALIGLPMSICSTGSIPMVAVLIHKGISPGAALAFLLTGSAINIAALGVLAQLHGKKSAFTFVAMVGFFAILVGLVANVFIPVQDLVPLHDIAAEPQGMVDSAALALLLVILLLSLLRQGIHGFVARIVPGRHVHGCTPNPVQNPFSPSVAPTALPSDVVTPHRL